jgi:cell division transport system permease protein
LPTIFEVFFEKVFHMSAGYVLREGFSGFFRAKLAVLASITAIALSIFLLSVLARIGWNAYQVAQTLKKSVEVELFLKDISETDKDRLLQTLRQHELVAKTTFISKDSAAAIFLEAFGAEGQALADLQFLPASIQVRMKETVTLAALDEAVKKWQTLQGVDELKYNRKLVEVLEQRIDQLLRLGLGLGLLVLGIAMLLVFNTIRLTIYAKKPVIRAMKLVGATNGFIRRPFQVEGLLQAVAGTAIALGMHHLLFSKIVPYFIPQLGTLSWPFDDWKMTAAGALAVSFAMGFIGSTLASWTFIKDTSVSGS